MQAGRQTVSPGRRAKDLGGVDLADVNAKTTLVFDVDPVQAGVDVLSRPGEEIVVPVRVSHNGAGCSSGDGRRVLECSR
jgi:hypothetical protein